MIWLSVWQWIKTWQLCCPHRWFFLEVPNGCWELGAPWWAAGLQFSSWSWRLMAAAVDSSRTRAMPSGRNAGDSWHYSKRASCKVLTIWRVLLSLQLMSFGSVLTDRTRQAFSRWILNPFNNTIQTNHLTKLVLNRKKNWESKYLNQNKP